MYIRLHGEQDNNLRTAFRIVLQNDHEIRTSKDSTMAGTEQNKVAILVIPKQIDTNIDKARKLCGARLLGRA